MARPTKLTPEMTRRIADLVRAGNYVETAAACVGISKDTLYRWLKRGARASSGLYADFARAVEKAQAESEARDVTLIAAAAREEWQAAAWRLERRFPQRWRRRTETEVTGRDGGPVEIVAGARERLAALIAAAVDPGAAGGGDPEPPGE